MADKIIDDVYWIGSDNPTGRNFHGVSTYRGGSYNSYLVKGKKLALIDGVNSPFFKSYDKSLRELVDPENVSFIIINHAETDHTGAMEDLLLLCPNAVVVCTERCRQFLIAAYGISCEFRIVAEGDSLDLGGKTLRFLLDPMCHWPETMVTCLVEDNMLFSGDLFASEVSHEAVFADQMKPFPVLTRDYFAVVLRPFARSVSNAIAKVSKLKIDYLAPSHGPVFRKDISKVMEEHNRLAGDPQERRVVIVYLSVWHGVEKMAMMLKDAFNSYSIPVRTFDLSKAGHITLMAEIMTSRAVLFGSLTFLGSYHPAFDTLFSYLKLIRQPGKIAGVFGSYGWAPASVAKLSDKVKELDYRLVGSFEARFNPRLPDHKKQATELARDIAEGITED